MTAQRDPANLQIAEDDLTEHFQLLQSCLSSLPGASPDGRFLVSIPVADSAEIIKSKFMRLSSESFPDLEGSQLKVLRKLCKAAYPSEQFFVTVAKNQCLRTAIKSDRATVNLFSLALIEEVISNTIIHSNVLPHDPYWTDGVSKSLHFPCSILKEASRERKTLMKKYHEWKARKEACDVVKHEQERSWGGNIGQRPLKKFWEIGTEVVQMGVLARGGQAEILLVTWRRGKFIRKDYKIPEEFKTEVDVMQRLCHPQIVYIFGISCAGMPSSLYMEYMQNDLLSVIIENVRRPDGNTGPPFSKDDSVDILLQIAKAMAHMHENEVIHGDLKSQNILISKFEISENRYHYLAKVADFGSARVKDSEPFQPADGTTYYAAPEVLEFRRDRTKVISVPKKAEKIDVYSFGLVAFEVLTGKTMEHVFKNVYPRELYPKQGVMREVKEGVMNGTLKPPLRAECPHGNFPPNDKLILLIERCWRRDPSERRSFSEVVEVLNSVRVEIREPTSPSNDPPRQASSVDDGNSGSPEEQASPSDDPPSQASSVDDGNSGAPEEALSRSNGHRPLLPDQANNTSAALRGQEAASGSNGRHPPLPPAALRDQVAGPSRRRRKFWKFLPFPCVSGGKVKS